MADRAEQQPGNGRSRPLALIAAVHTLIWLWIESCVVDVLGAGLAGRSDRSVAVAGTIVAAETLVFAANGFRCPLAAGLHGRNLWRRRRPVPETSGMRT